MITAMRHGRMPSLLGLGEADRRRIGYLAEVVARRLEPIVGRKVLNDLAEEIYQVGITDHLPMVPLIPGVSGPADKIAADWRLTSGLDISAFRSAEAELIRATVNTHDVLDRTKLLMHRLIARTLQVRPDLIETAKRRLDQLEADGRRLTLYQLQWRELLAAGVDVVRRRIIQRDEATKALLTDSPLCLSEGMFADVVLRRRMHRKARQGLVLRALSTGGNII